MKNKGKVKTIHCNSTMSKKRGSKKKDIDPGPSPVISFSSKKMNPKKTKSRDKKRKGEQFNESNSKMSKSNPFRRLPNLDDDYDNDQGLREGLSSDDEVYDLVLENSEDESEGSDKADEEEKESEEDVDEEGEGKDSSSESETEEPALKKAKLHNELTDNTDFIGFDFSSDEEAKDEKEMVKDYSYDNYDSDDAYLSNDEQGYYPKSAAHKTGHLNPQYPWIRNNNHSKQIEISDWLTMEIKDFVRYISPSAQEIKARNQTVQKLRDCITSMWPDSEVQCFGSFATDLYLPGSDIDMVVLSKQRNGKFDNKSSLYQLSSYLRNNKLATNIETIAKAKVPIIKFVDAVHKIHIDVSFERTNGVIAAGDITEWIKTTPGLRELVLVVKQFLAVRRLNVVHTGGLGGYSIICLVYSFLRLHPRISTGSIDPLENIGALLIEFFELYGFNFGYDNVAIAFNESKNPYYIKKSSNSDLLSRSPFSLAIQDPRDSSNNISRGTFNLRDIKRAFAGAFELLTNKCYQMHSATYKERLGQSILGDIIKYNGKQRDFEDARDSVVNNEFASSNGKKANYGLPPLPSEKSGRKLSDNDYFDVMSSSEDESDDDDDDDIQEIWETSQSSNAKPAQKKRKIDEFMGIEEDKPEEEQVQPANNNGKSAIVIDDDSSDDSEVEEKAVAMNPRVSSVDKNTKREYWSKKSGESF